MRKQAINPTTQLYAQLLQAAEHFNRTLFDGTLQNVVFTLQREKTASGYFSPARWRHQDGAQVSEIAINPRYVATRPLLRLFQTIVHEQCHLWQHQFGKVSRAGYHNEEWAEKMEEVGLIPTDTGLPNGKRTGQKMSDYPAENGLFIQACMDLVTSGFRFSWIDENADEEVIQRSIDDYPLSFPGNIAPLLLKPLYNGFLEFKNQRHEAVVSQKRKVKYTCSQCQTNVWGKSGLSIVCGECGEHYEVLKVSGSAAHDALPDQPSCEDLDR